MGIWVPVKSKYKLEQNHTMEIPHLGFYVLRVGSIAKVYNY